jgi:hypothetical protein
MIPNKVRLAKLTTTGDASIELLSRERWCGYSAANDIYALPCGYGASYRNGAIVKVFPLCFSNGYSPYITCYYAFVVLFLVG